METRLDAEASGAIVRVTAAGWRFGSGRLKHSEGLPRRAELGEEWENRGCVETRLEFCVERLAYFYLHLARRAGRGGFV